MDLDHIRFLVLNGEVRFSDKFDRMVQAREFTPEQALHVVREGRVIGEERGKGRVVKLVVGHAIERANSV